MKYAQKFELKCYDVLREYFKRKIDEYDGEQYHIFEISDIPEEIDDLFKNELAEKGLPANLNWLVFKKKDCFDESHNMTHVDTLSTDVSIVIPIEGCENTYMYWCEGEYDLHQTSLDDSYFSYNIPIWTEGSTPTIHREAILSPTICKVSVPHNTCSSHDGSYRVVVTTRLSVNLSFEEVCEKLSN